MGDQRHPYSCQDETGQGARFLKCSRVLTSRYKGLARVSAGDRVAGVKPAAKELYAGMANAAPPRALSRSRREGLVRVKVVVRLFPGFRLMVRSP